MKVLKKQSWKTRFCIGMYNYYTNSFRDGSLNYDKLSPSEKELYHICSVITLKERGMIERPDFLNIE